MDLRGIALTQGKVAFELVLVMLISLNIASSQGITENLTAINESDPTFWYNKGEELLNASKYNESIEAFDEAIRLDPNNETIWLDRSEIFLEMDSFDEAVKTIDRAIELNQSNEMAWIVKGIILAEYKIVPFA